MTLVAAAAAAAAAHTWHRWAVASLDDRIDIPASVEGEENRAVAVGGVAVVTADSCTVQPIPAGSGLGCGTESLAHGAPAGPEPARTWHPALAALAGWGPGCETATPGPVALVGSPAAAAAADTWHPALAAQV